MLVDYSAFLQPATAFSTPDAETVALCQATVKGLIPCVSLIECLVKRDLATTTASDSSTAIGVIRAGYSRKLGY